MIDGWATLAGAIAAAGWLSYVLVSALLTVRTGCWPFFIPRATALAWETARGRSAGWAGAVIVVVFALLISLGTLAVGGAVLLGTQALLDVLAAP